METAQDSKLQEKLDQLDAALAQGETAELWNDWATLQFASGNTGRAEEGYRRALDLDGAARHAAVNLGLLLFAQGRLQEGVPLLEQHKSTLTDTEKSTILDLANRFKVEIASKGTAEEAEPKNKPKIRTFDLFDTLVARRCVNPKAIFAMMEQQSGIAGLAQLRVRAEAMAATGPYTIRDIYRQLGTLLGATDEEINSLLTLELKLERDNLLPIQEVTSKVQPGDLIVSDMYLPEKFLQEVVERVAGLSCNPVVVTTNGKATGRIWAPLKKSFEIVEHVGDNPHADIQSARMNGIPTVHTTLANLTTEEQEVAGFGFPGLARTMREARLSSFHPNGAMRSLQLAQCEGNFPMLFLASLALHRKLIADNRQHVLMSSRDCFLWRHLLEVVRDMLGGQYQVTYFMTSRVSRVFPSATYLRYFENLIGKPACVVDLCGTGWSLKRLIERTRVSKTPILILCRYDLPDLENAYQSFAKTEIIANIHSILTARNDVIERANFARHPMVLDVKEVDGRFIPVMTNPAGVAWNEIPEIKIQHEAFFRALEALKRNDLTEDLRAKDEAVMLAVQRSFLRLATYGPSFKFADDFTRREEASTISLLNEAKTRDGDSRCASVSNKN